MAKSNGDFSADCGPIAGSEIDGLDRTFDSAGVEPAAVAYPVIADRAEWSEVITHYDRQHFLTYARLLSAEQDEVDWRQGVRGILRQDPDKDPRQARICWESHLERARWIVTEGVRQAVGSANAQ
jgi:hypothetical protein